MRKLLTEQDNCYTPKYLVDYFGKFDYDPATTKEQAEYLGIKNYDTIETDGLKQEWNYNKIWINPPFSMKFKFLEKAIKTYKKYHNKIFMLFPIESMTTKKWFDTIDGCNFRMFIPNYRIGFIVDNKEYKSGAFGVVIIEFNDYMDIVLLRK